MRGWVGVSKALLGGEIADAGEEMTPFPQPIELDAVLDTTWEPVAEVVLRKVGGSHRRRRVTIARLLTKVKKTSAPLKPTAVSFNRPALANFFNFFFHRICI